MMRRWRKCYLMMKGEVSGGWFLRIIKEGKININLCYMIIGGIFTLVI